MPPTTALRVLGGVIAGAWAAQLGAIATSIYLLAHTVNVPLNAWFFLGVHLLLAAAGVAAGLLAIRGTRAWKWWALVSGLVFLFLADLGWYSLRNSYGDMIRYLVHNPRVAFSVLVMPLLAIFSTSVAVWTLVLDAFGRRHSRI
jgi:Kef-type K+ transport system membrane component KefB